MRYAWLEFASPPEILFAHIHQTDHYEHRIDARGDLVEITRVDSGELLLMRPDGDSAIIRPGDLLVNSYREPILLSCPRPPHRHTTVGLRLRFASTPMDAIQAAAAARARADAPDTYGALLPERLPGGPQTPEVGALVEKIVREHQPLLPFSRANDAHLAFELLCALSRAAAQQLGGHPASALSNARYARRAMEFVSAHLSEKLTVGRVAAHLGVSEGHLSRLFRAESGRTLINYIGNRRIEMAKVLLTQRDMTLEQVGLAVGIEDPDYLSRLFRQCVGVSAREYRCACHVVVDSKDAPPVR